MKSYDPDRVTATEIRDWRSRNYLDADHSSLEQRVLADHIATPQDLKGLTMNTTPYQGMTVEALRIRKAAADDSVKTYKARLKTADEQVKAYTAFLRGYTTNQTEAAAILAHAQATQASLTVALAEVELVAAKKLFDTINKIGTPEQKADLSKFLGTLKPLVTLIEAAGYNMVRVQGDSIELVYKLGTPSEFVTTGFPSVAAAQHWARGRVAQRTQWYSRTYLPDAYRDTQ